MQDPFSHQRPPRRRRRGFLSRLWSALFGAVFGVLLAALALAMAFFNEGRADPSVLAARSVEVDPARPDAAREGAFVSASGLARADGTVSDGSYLLAGPWLSLRRSVEMFAWVEVEDRSGRDPRVYYERRWTTHPPDSNRFRDPRGHYNPPLREREGSWVSGEATLAALRFQPRDAHLPGLAPLYVSQAMLRRGAPNGARALEGWVFFGSGTPSSPVIGDHRLGYRGVDPTGTSTLFGELRGRQVVAHAIQGSTFLRLARGDRPAALAAMHAEHLATVWFLRIGAWALLWFGLLLVAEPGSAMLDLLPPLGRASRTLAALLLLPVSATLMALTVLLSLALHGSLLGAVLLGLLAALALAWLASPKSTPL